MNILWLCNVKLPQVSKALSEKSSPFGGWITDMAEKILADKENRLTALYPGTHEAEGKIDNLSYYSFLEKDCDGRFADILRKESPEIVHIWGTEFGHSLRMAHACEKSGIIDRAVISIQGLVSIYCKHYSLGLPDKVVRHKTFHELVRGNNIRHAVMDFKRRGLDEISAIEKVRHIVGRTDFDRACTTQINENVNYHFCNETLRREFYDKKWSTENIKRHSIFVSQCNYPVKGFHFLLEAMPLILKRFPDAHIYTVGTGFSDVSLLGRLRANSYEKYLHGLIKKHGLESHITFLDYQSAERMCCQYLAANVFVSPSTIENSSNSIGEAMLLGCPVVCSDVGGICSLLRHGEEGYTYQVDAPYMLAYYVCGIFADDALALSLSERAGERARITHSPDVNFNTLIDIYSEIKGPSRIAEDKRC